MAGEALDPEVETLYHFVWRRTEERVRAAAERSDDPAHAFALGTLRILERLRQHLDRRTIGGELGARYLRRQAALHRHHPEFRADWLL